MLGIRLDPQTERSLDAIARRQRQTKSQIAREAIRYWVARADSLERAKAEWRAVSDRERADPGMTAMLGSALDELDLPE